MPDAALTATVTFGSHSDAKEALNLNGKIFRGRNISVDREFMGLTVLAAPPNSKVDILAVHGLNGHAFGTWACRDDSQASSELMWLRDFLPEQVQGARILVYGYNSALIGPTTSVSNVKDFACDLLQRILDDRKDSEIGLRPLVFICHSLGGIVVKQAFVFAHADPKRYHSLDAAIRSMLFLATPHGGSKTANIGSVLSSVATLAFQRPSKQLLETLKLQSPLLCQLSDDFCAISSSLNIVNFYERRKTPILSSLIVDEVSSKLGLEHEILIPMDATHRDICTYYAPSDPLYLPVLAQIVRCSSIQSAKLDEPLAVPGSCSLESTRSEAHAPPGRFIVPVSSNPNFAGREQELAMIDNYLSPQNDSHGPRCPIVAIFGLGGVGKTQLVTEYTYTLKAKKPSDSILWTSARSNEEIEIGFQHIAKRLSLTRDLGGHVRQSGSHEDMNTVPPLENPGEGLRLLQDWMQLLDHEDWMLVLDNYDDVQVDIRSFIPVGAVGRILVTSRDRRIIGSVASSGFALSEMRVEDAKRLFLSIRGRCAQDGKVDDDSSDPEDEVLQQILHELQYFPLAIDQAASFIRENAPMTLVEYLDFLRPRGVDRERLMRFKEANPAYPESVMTTWEISLHHLQQSRPRTAWILQVLGFLDHSYIAEELLVATNETRPWVFNSTFQGRQLPPNLLDDLKYLNNDVGFRLAIGTLTSLSLIKRNASQRTLYVHPLVHEWIRVRLNSDPTKQAEFTIAAILILYQSFPLELVTWLPDQFPSMSVELHQRVDETTHHLRAVLANIRDYHHHIVTLPLECFTLMEVYYLTGLPQHAIYALDLPKALLVKLQAVIRLLVPHLPPGQKELAHFVHKATIWIQSGPSVKTDLKVPNKIVKSLESLALPLWLSDDDATFIMLFSTTVIDASKKTVGNRMPGNDVFTEASIVEKSPLRKCSLLLLMGLHTLLTAISRESRLMSWVMFMVQLRLFRNMSPEEFAKLDVFHIDYLVSAEVLGYLEPNQRATHLCRLMQLYWASPWPRDYLAIVKLFDTGLAESKARLAEEQREVEMQRDEEFIKLSSYKDYISSSSGRVYESMGGINRTNKHTDLITPFNYFWTITLDLAESLSSPDLCWKLDSQSSNKSTKLDLAQRKWALKNVPSTKKLYERIREEQGEDSRTEASFLKRFEDVEVAFTLVIVYKNLEDWPRLQTAVWKSLQCDNILAWCKKSGHTPWEPRKRKSDTSQIEREKGDLRRPQMTQSPISQSQTSQVRLGKMSSAISLRVDTKNPEHAWKEWHTWLQAAAYEPSQTVSSHMYSGDIEDRLRELPEMRKFGLPDSCNCILRNRVDDIIAAFIALCEHKEAISQSDAIGETARLGSLSSILPLGARYLGRLEIIYYLSEAFLAKVPRSELNTYRLEASDETQDLSAESSEEEDTEGAEDIFQMDENAGGEDLDWTW